MLSWTLQNDGWHANGYQIKLEAPYRWVLTEDQAAAPVDTGTISYVSTVPPPLAMTRTLTEAKREAELRTAARYRAAMRRRHSAILLLLVGTALLFVGNSELQSLGVLLLVTYFVLRSLGVIVGTWLWRLAGVTHETIFYQ